MYSVISGLFAMLNVVIGRLRVEYARNDPILRRNKSMNNFNSLSEILSLSQWSSQLYEAVGHIAKC